MDQNRKVKIKDAVIPMTEYCENTFCGVCRIRKLCDAAENAGLGTLNHYLRRCVLGSVTSKKDYE